MTPSISLIIPAYNESQRIQTTLQTVQQWCAVQSHSYEVIVVDDGSTDATPVLLESAQTQWPELRVISNQHRGKACAVRTGVFAATGTYVAFTDADLSTPLSELSRLLAALESGAHVAIGSREGLGAKRIGEPLHRHVMGRVFNRLVMLLLTQSFRDTQCGFKAFQRSVAVRLFKQSRLYTDAAPILKHSAVTAFDVELLFLAMMNGYTVCEVPVQWQYRAGSKVHPLRDTVTLLRDVLLVRWNALCGRYGNRTTGFGMSYADEIEEAARVSI